MRSRALSTGVGQRQVRSKDVEITSASERINSSQEAAQLVIERGEFDEITDFKLIWFRREHWKRIVTSKMYFGYNSPPKHIDSMEAVIDYRVRVENISENAAFNCGVNVERY